MYPFKNEKIIENNIEENALKIIEYNNFLSFIFNFLLIEHFNMEKQEFSSKEVNNSSV